MKMTHGLNESVLKTGWHQRNRVFKIILPKDSRENVASCMTIGPKQVKVENEKLKSKKNPHGTKYVDKLIKTVNDYYKRNNCARIKLNRGYPHELPKMWKSKEE